ncbi:MAG: pitrilysin family protein, partial [Gammaproteobacteria bacterium]|nr:pitrilysin family protein [Gammaproteobacteria bacterium]
MRAFRILCLLLVWPAVLSAQNLPDGIERITTVEGITEYRLDNGLQVLLFPDPSSATITVNMTYLVGSVHEGYGETGMAHLLEHMLFKGTPTYPDPPKELQDRGANFNGSTSWDYTNYYETFDATEDNLAWALEFEADRMINANIAQEDLDSEMTVVRNEFERTENDPISVLLFRVLSTGYIWHSYGNPPIGSRADIENVPIPRLRAFYERYYQPDNAVLIVAGRIDEQRTLELVADTFGRIPRPERELIDTYTEEPVQDGERIVHLNRVGDLQAVMAGYHVPPGAHEDFVPLQIAARALVDAPSGRMYRALVEPGLAAQVGSQELQLRDPSMFIFYALVRPDGDLEAARDIMLATIDELATTPITEEEVERIKNQALSQLERAMNNTQAIALQLSSWAAMGDWRMLFLDRDRVRSVTAEQAQAAALNYFKQSNRTVGMFTPDPAPERAVIPPKPDLVALLDGYTGDEGRSVGEAFDPSPENIDARTIRREVGDGIEIAMVPKETRGDQVNATIRLHIGDLESLTGRDTVASLTARMLMRGTESHSRQDIQDELDRLQSRLSVGGGAGTVTASIQSTRDNLAAVLELAYEVLREPAFPENELRTMKEAELAGIESQRSEPDAIVQRAMARHLGQNYAPGDPRYTPTFDESIEALNAVGVDDLREFHRDFFGASTTHVAAVGDFDPDEFVASIEAGLGDWESPIAYEQITTPYPDPVPAPVNQSFDTPDKENAYFYLLQPIRMTDEHPDYPALVLGNYVLGSGMNSRLFARIRGDEGLSYGVASGFSAPTSSDGARFAGQAIAAPQNIPQVEASFLDEIANVLRDGYSDDEVEAAKRSWAQNQQLSRAQDGSVVGMLLSNLHYDRT